MPLCLHLTVMLIAQYTLISNYDANCDFRFREVLVGDHKSYLGVAKIYQVVNSFQVLIVSDNTTWSGRLFQALTTLLVKLITQVILGSTFV